MSAVRGVWLGAALLSACAWRSEEAEPVEVAIALDFPSITAAVAIDHVSVVAYDGATSCAELLRLRRGGEVMPEAHARSSASVCDYFYGKVSLQVPFGRRTLLAVAERGIDRRSEVLLGCVEQTLGEGDALLPIKLSLVSGGQSSLPGTKCRSLTDYCAQECE